MNRSARNFGFLFWINSIAFVFYGVFIFFPTLRDGDIGRYLHSGVVLFISFFLVGQNGVAIIEKMSRQHFSLLEKFSIIPIISLFVSPLAVTLSIHLTTDWLRFTPVILAGVTSCLATWIQPFFWENTTETKYSPHLLPAGLLAGTLYLVLFFHLTTSYYALPDFDPYYWLQKFQSEYSKDYVTDIRLHRPLFSSVGYIFFQTGGIDLYAYFKYLLPALTLILLFPVALIANRMQRFSDALLVFFLPAISGSFILYSFSSIPQTVLNLSFLFGIYFIVYSFIAKKPVFYFFAGGIFGLSTFYHEMAILFFIPWIGFTLFCYRREISSFIRRNPLTTLLILMLMLSHLFSAFFEIGRFLVSWTEKIFHGLVRLQPNFAFPATYINIDGNPVGWGNWSGVARYYAFYLGPLVGLSLVALWQNFLQKQIPTLIPMKRTALENATLRFLFSILILFFAMAEVLPRFFNIALLPERAMGFFGAIVLAFLMIALASDVRRPWASILSILLIGTAFINAGAALYINAEKRFLITPTQISSAEWIRGALPTDRIILTGSHWNLIRFHSQTEAAIEVSDPQFYRDIRVFDAVKKNLPSENQLYSSSFGKLLTDLEKSVRILNTLNPINDRDQVYSELVLNKNITETFLASKYSDNAEKKSKKPASIFVYYAKPSKENPYANRPYMKPSQIEHSTDSLAFDRYPDRFQRVYELPDDEVVIWKLIQ
ncbi:MAG: hypothetical protein ACEQSB_00800 [Undibacterium sp.]